MGKDYMTVRAVAEAAGVSVQAVYKWIEKGELPAKVVRISEYEKRYQVPRRDADRLIKRARTVPRPGQSRERNVSASPGKGKADEKVLPKPLTGAELAKRLEENGLIGLWADRDDIGDSVEFARKLRKQASTRRR